MIPAPTGRWTCPRPRRSQAVRAGVNRNFRLDTVPPVRHNDGMTTATFTVSVTPTVAEFQPDPVNWKLNLNVVVTKSVPNGVDGPFTTGFMPSDDLVDWLAGHGFKLAGDFGPMCGNGFATAKLAKIGERDVPADSDAMLHTEMWGS